MPSCVSQKDKSHDDLMGVDLKCIKCGMGRRGEDLCNKCRIPEVKLAFGEEREKGERQEWDIFRGTRVLKVRRGGEDAGKNRL